MYTAQMNKGTECPVDLCVNMEGIPIISLRSANSFRAKTLYYKDEMYLPTPKPNNNVLVLSLSSY